MRGAFILPLAGLIIASEDADQVDLAACLPVAGMTLLEYQIRQARSAGAGHIVVLASRMPQALVTALDRLARDKITPDIARSARDAADRIHPEESLLVMADGIFAPPDVIAHVAGSLQPLLLTRDAEGAGAFERIDGSAHWTGLALLDGGMLRETASLLGDWALGPTLLRIAVQRAVMRDHLSAAETDHVLHLAGEGDAIVANRLLASVPVGEGGWINRIYGALGKLALPPLMNRAGLIDLVPLFPLALIALALIAGVAGWVHSGIGLLIAAHFPAWLADRLGRATSHRTRMLDLVMPAIPWAASALCLLLAWYSYQVLADRAMLSLGLVAGLSLHNAESGKPTLDAVLAMLVLLLCSLSGFADIGFLLVILAGILPALWGRFKSRNLS